MSESFGTNAVGIPGQKCANSLIYINEFVQNQMVGSSIHLWGKAAMPQHIKFNEDDKSAILLQNNKFKQE